jgi:hypothetical protein
MRTSTVSRPGLVLACLVLVAGASGAATAAEATVAFAESTATVLQGERATLTIQFSGNVSAARFGVVGPDGENRTGRQLVDANGDDAVRVRVDTATTGDGFLTVLGDDTSRHAAFDAGTAAPPLAPGRYELRLSVDGEVRDVGVLVVEGEATATPSTTASTTPTATPSTTASTTVTESTVPIPGFGPAVAAAALALAGFAFVRLGRGGRR